MKIPAHPVPQASAAAPTERETPEREFESKLYESYSNWKGWSDHFTCGGLDRERFREDFAGIDLAGKALLEIGFGPGALLAWAREMGAVVTGSEINAESLAAASREGIPVVPPDFERTGALADGSFDIVVAYDVFEHLDAPTLKAKLVALDRALRPGGLLVLRYPNGQSPFGLPSQHGDVTHLQALSEMKVTQLADGTGLVTQSYRGAAFAAHPRLVHRVAVWFRNRLRRAIIRVIQFAIATDIPLEPVMVHILRKAR